MRKILITGSQGFVGRHFFRELYQDRNNEIDTVDLQWDEIDCRDFFRQSDTRYDLVIHLAAVVGGRMTIENSPLSVAVDLSIDAEMFQFALRTRPHRVVYFSSSAVYPVEWQASKHFLREAQIRLDDIRSPDMTYGFAKLAGEYQASFLEAEGIRTHVFRPFSGYGEDQDLAYPFPSFIARALRRDDPFVIWGDGSAVRDFIHIDDIVEGVLTAIDNDVKGPVNLGTGIGTRFNELAEMVTALAGYTPEYTHLLDKPVGVQYRVADTEKFNSFYTPKIPLELGIKRSLGLVRS